MNFKSNELIADILILLKNILSDKDAIDVAIIERESISLEGLHEFMDFSKCGKGCISLSTLKTLGVIHSNGHIGDTPLSQELGFKFDRDRIDCLLYQELGLTDTQKLVLDAALFKASFLISQVPPYNRIYSNFENTQSKHPEVMHLLTHDLREMMLSRISKIISFNKYNQSDRFLSELDLEITRAREVATYEYAISIDEDLLSKEVIAERKISIEKQLIIRNQCDWISYHSNKPDEHQQPEYDAKFALLMLRHKIVMQTICLEGWGIHSQYTPHLFQTGTGPSDVRTVPERANQLLERINNAFEEQNLDLEHFQTARKEVDKIIKEYTRTGHSSETSIKFFDKLKDELALRQGSLPIESIIATP